MAVYIPVIVEENIVGDTPILVREDGASDGMALLLNTLAETKYLITGVTLWSSNISQLSNPVVISTVEANGNIKQKAFTPGVDNYQYQNKVLVDTEGWELDQFTRLNYKIEPNTVLRMSFNTFTNKDLSLSDTLDDITGEYGILEDVKDELEFNELEEFSDFYIKPVDDSMNEPEELKNIPKLAIEYDDELPESIKKAAFDRLKSQKKPAKTENKTLVRTSYDVDFVVILAIAAPIVLLASKKGLKSAFKI